MLSCGVGSVETIPECFLDRRCIIREVSGKSGMHSGNTHENVVACVVDFADGD